MSFARSPRARWTLLLAAMLGGTSAGCDDILGLEELRVADASSTGASAGGSGGTGGSGIGGATSTSVGGGATGGGGSRPCDAPAGPQLIGPGILDPLDVAVGADRVFWIERTDNISLLKSRDGCGDDPRIDSMTNRDPAPYLSASGDDACWVTTTVASARLQCGNNANQGNDLEEYSSASSILGDVALTANGLYWLEQLDDNPWSVRYAARGALDSPMTVYEADMGVTLTAIAASADVVAWLEYDRLTGTVVTAPATGTSLDTTRYLDTASPYKDVAVFAKRVLYTDGMHVRELDVSGGNMPELDYTAGDRVRQVAFDPTGERFALATDEVLGAWFAIHLQTDDGGPKVAEDMVDPRAFAVSADAIFYLQTSAGPGLYRQAR